MRLDDLEDRDVLAFAVAQLCRDDLSEPTGSAGLPSEPPAEERSFSSRLSRIRVAQPRIVRRLLRGRATPGVKPDDGPLGLELSRPRTAARLFLDEMVLAAKSLDAESSQLDSLTANDRDLAGFLIALARASDARH